MFKWIFIFFIVFFGLWLFEYNLIPQKITHSGPGKVFNTTLFSLNYKIHASSRNSKKFDASLVAIDDSRIQSVINSVGTTSKNAVIYFYDTHSIFSRIILNDINDLAQVHSGDTIFMVVAFDDNRDRVDYLLSGFDRLYFRPLLAQPDGIKSAGYALAKKTIMISGLPTIIFKDATSANYRNLTADFSTKKELAGLLTK